MEYKIFWKAIQKGHIALAQQLFPYLTFSQAEKGTIFQAALKDSNYFYIFLIDQLTEEELTPYLHKALLASHEEAVALLLQKGADPKMPTQYGEVPLSLAIKPQGTSIKILNDLIDYGADIFQENRHKGTPLLKAASLGLIEVVDFIVQKGGELNEDVLSRGASNNHVNVVQYCLAGGIKVPQKAYYMSLFYGHGDMVKYLTKVDRQRFTANCLYNPLVIAASNGRREILELFLKKKLPEERNERVTLCSTALMAAVEAGHGHLVQMLLDAGADINYMDEGESMVDVAQGAGHKNIASYLIRRGGCNHKEVFHKNVHQFIQ
ncbi:ankyrin repeat domain-containing protein [Neobacillus niacini]|uniref:ankyrin repeat domain-containing protein n=1 Tax=Neobacillus niacini TaxID=86668 RepID=UPI0021CB098A|nr:ankyrin repeat domain-containing protein [Neobacillus niacini]MCM3763829.1 ankyrin repeat domain-containing protein [Neobacillus niacini]